MQISNWGKFPEVEGQELFLRNKESLPFPENWIPRGMGRCYGDSSLGEHMISSLKLNKFLSFEPKSGILSCQAGVTYEDILTTFVPKGWFPPVTPGTKFVSMGGAIASDVHGKNHHSEGAISDHLLDFSLLTASGEILGCSRTQNAEIFHATVGGMGLTGFILDLRIQLKPIESAWIQMESIKARNLEEIIELSESFSDATYTMAWIDCLASGRKMGRSILMKGEHAPLEILTNKRQQAPLTLPSKKKLTVPFDFPSFVLNPLSIKAFNFLYYHKQLKKKVEKLVDYDSFFYPLDSIYHWNRIYGKKGFIQYQFVLPKEHSLKGLHDILHRISEKNMGSFLAVLKLFGKQDSFISFPMEGFTLALDFPITRGLFPFLEELDKVVLAYGGRVYLTKDARLSAEIIEEMYPNLPTFKSIINRLDPEGNIRSIQSERLKLHTEALPEVK
ncbi:MAG: FAD-binding oxidoreductase [Bacteroidota bacterium]